MGHFVPHTDADIDGMLGFLGLSSLEELFSTIPEALRLTGLDLPAGLSEPDVMVEMERLAGGNRAVGRDLVCFAGAGAYDHDIPAVVRRVAMRAEFVTAYTPYPPELAPGVLQALVGSPTSVCRAFGR